MQVHLGLLLLIYRYRERIEKGCYRSEGADDSRMTRAYAEMWLKGSGTKFEPHDSELEILQANPREESHRPYSHRSPSLYYETAFKPRLVCKT